MVWRGEAFAVLVHRTVEEKDSIIGIEDIFATDQLRGTVTHDIGDREQEVVADNCGSVDPALAACLVIVAMHIAFPVEKEYLTLSIMVDVCNGHALSLSDIFSGIDSLFQNSRFSVKDQQSR